MTDYMRALTEKYLYCVKSVISTRIRVPNKPMLEYDDLYQVGCLALCRAASLYDSSRGEFEPYACTAIYNAIVTYCNKQYTQSERIADVDLGADDDAFSLYLESKGAREALDAVEVSPMTDALRESKSRYTGIVRKGIEALEYKVVGLTTSEIAEIYHTNVKNVNAWISRARKVLKQDRDFWAGFR